MGIKTLWTHLDHACAVTTLQEEAWQYFKKSPHQALRLGIDASGWVFHAEPMYTKAGANPLGPVRTLFFRLSNLFTLPILPVFVFDGPERPRWKHGSNRPTGLDMNKHPLVRDFRLLVRSFGFVDWDAPGEAEAELAWMNQAGLIDVVLTDDVDSFVFGATKVMRNLLIYTSFTMSDVTDVQKRKREALARTSSQDSRGSELPSELNFVNLSNNQWGSNPVGLYTFPRNSQYPWPERIQPEVLGWREPEPPSAPPSMDDDEVAQLDIPLSRSAILIVAILTGGDYNLQGVEKCGMVISKVFAALGIGHRFVEALVDSLQGSSDESKLSKLPVYDKSLWVPRLDLDEDKWDKERETIISDMVEELCSNSCGFMRSKQPLAANGLEGLFATPEDQSVLGLYIWPRTTHLRVREGSLDELPKIEFDTDRGGATGIRLSSVEEELLRQRVDPRSRLESSPKCFQPLDLAHLLFVLRKQFNWSDEKIRQRVQTMIGPGLLLRLLRDELMSEFASGWGGHPLLLYQPSVPKVPSQGKTAATGLSPSPSPPLPDDLPPATNNEKQGLFGLIEVIRARQIGERTEYRVRYSDQPLDHTVQLLLGKMPKFRKDWVPPPIPRRLSKNPAPVPVATPAAPSEDGSTGKPRAAASYHPEPQLLWLDSYPLQNTWIGKRLIDQFNAKVQAKEEAKAQKAQPKLPGQSSSRARPISSSSSQQASRGVNSFNRASSTSSFTRQVSLEQAFGTPRSHRTSSTMSGACSASHGTIRPSPPLSSSDEDMPLQAGTRRPSLTTRRRLSIDQQPTPNGSTRPQPRSVRTFRENRSRTTPSSSHLRNAPTTRVAQHPDLSIVPDQTERDDIFASFFHNSSDDDGGALVDCFTPPRASSPPERTRSVPTAVASPAGPRDGSPADVQLGDATAVRLDDAAPRRSPVRRLRQPSCYRPVSQRLTEPPAPARTAPCQPIYVELSDNSESDPSPSSQRSLPRRNLQRATSGYQRSSARSLRSTTEVVDLVSD